MGEIVWRNISPEGLFHAAVLVVLALAVSEGALILLSRCRTPLWVGVAWFLVGLLLDGIYVPLLAAHWSGPRVVWTVGVLYAHWSASWYIAARYALRTRTDERGGRSAAVSILLFGIPPSLAHGVFIFLIYR